jgi:type I restriction enzyme S subunit
MNKENKLVPEFRFPTFKNEGEWEEKVVSQLAEYENGKAHEQDINEEGKYVVVNSKFISTDGEVRKYTNSANCIAQKDDILMVLSDVPNGRAIAKCFVVDRDNFYTVNQRICKLTPTNANSKILYYLLNRNAYFLNFDDGVKQTNLRNEDVLNCPLVLPKKPKEQEKIASCLSSLDETIKAHSQKLELLKDHKKGLMQNLFPQEGEKVPKYRFKEFVNDGVWVEKLLSEVANYENGKAHEQNISDEGKFVVVNSKFISTDGAVAKYSNKAFCLAEKGDVLMVLSDVPNGRAIAKCFYVYEENKYTVNQRICKITSFDCDSLFIFYLMNRNPYFLSFDDGVKQTNLRNDDVQSFPFFIPSNIKEQQKIASCISSFLCKFN